MYRITLQKESMHAAVNGFRRVGENGKRYQDRLFVSQGEIDEFEGDMWARGFRINIKEIKRD